MPLPLRRLLQLVSIVRKIKIRYLIAGVFLSAASYAQVGGPGTVIVGGGGSGGSGTIGGTLTATDDLLVCTDGTGGSTIGACTVGNLDNLRLDGNTISSTDTNGNIVLAPNGTGQITVPNGSETKPAIALAESATKGISFSQNGQGNFAWVDSNQVRLFIGSQETRTQADNFYGWTSSTSEGGGATTNDTALGRAAAGIVSVNDGTASGGAALHLNPLASPPRTCDATAEGDIYSDTSHALCWCDASAWQKLSGAGTCA